jgi:hypothetical protein
VYAASSAANAERQLRKHPHTAVVVTGSCLHGGEDGLSVCRLARDASIPTVMLTSFDVPEAKSGGLVDRIIRKKDTSVLRTVEEVCKVAASIGGGM